MKSNTPLIFTVDGRSELVDDIFNAYHNVGRDTTTDILDRGRISIRKFSDSEITTQYEDSIRGVKVFLVCSTNSPENIITLMLAADAARRASAEEVTAVIPYFGYARQDRKDGLRGAIGAKVIANTLIANGIDRIITLELHADQIQGFVNIPVDHIDGKNIFVNQIEKLIEENKLDASNITLIAPDAGAVKRVDICFKLLTSKYPDIEFAMMNKIRDKANSVAKSFLIGSVKGKDVIILDDMIDTAGTLSKGSIELKEKGAKSITAMAIHGVFSGPDVVDNLNSSQIDKIYVTNSLHIQSDVLRRSKKIEQISCAEPLSMLIKAVINKTSSNRITTIY